MEVSSQAYKTKRVYGLTFDVGVFLNISPDHIGPIEHPTFEDYFYCKRQLLDNSKFIVANASMDHFEIVKEQCEDKRHVFYTGESENQISESTSFNFQTTGAFEAKFSINLLGKFNQENALAVALACQELGASKSDITEGIAEATVPGRMEVLTQKNGAKAYVDYAHNGISLKNLLDVVSSAHPANISLVLGAPGNKGESRRKDFGLLLNEYPNIKVILTADDPNFENPSDIIDEIAQYITRDIEKIVDRESAIKYALAHSKDYQDAVIIAGKGADAYQIINGQHTEYDGDLEVAKRYL